MDFPQDFRCPISMELMHDPVTISTGITYERKNIEKWFNKYKKNTCPATMQIISDFNLTPNNSLKRLISTWENERNRSYCSNQSPPPINRIEIVKLLEDIESTPFVVSTLKKLRSMVDLGTDEIKNKIKESKSIKIILKIVVEILVEGSDFVTFRACEEAIGVLDTILSYEGFEEMMKYFSKPEVVKSMAIMLQRGSSEARFHTISIFKKMAKFDFNSISIIHDQGIDFFKSVLEIISDEICRKASSCALEVLIDITISSKKSRLKVIEAGAICILVELLPDSGKSKSDKILNLIKLLCECAEGRLAFVEHGLGIAAISKKMLNISDGATKFSVRIFWLIISNSHPPDRVLEEMLMCGAVKKMVDLLHIDGRSSTKDKVVKILKIHASSWGKFPCFPSDLKNYLGMGFDR